MDQLDLISEITISKRKKLQLRLRDFYIGNDRLV